MCHNSKLLRRLGGMSLLCFSTLSLLAEISPEILLQTGHGYLHSIDISPDGKTVASGGGYHHQYSAGAVDFSVKLWDVKQAKLSKNLPGHTAPVRSVAFSP